MFLVGFFTLLKKPTLVVTLFFFLWIATNFPFFPKIIPGMLFQCMQVQSITTTGKYSRTPNVPSTKLFNTVRQKKCSCKNRDTLPLWSFSVTGPFRNTQGSNLRISLGHPLWFTRIFAPDRWAAPTLSCSQLALHNCVFLLLSFGTKHWQQNFFMKWWYNEKIEVTSEMISNRGRHQKDDIGEKYKKIAQKREWPLYKSPLIYGYNQTWNVR